MSKHIIQPKQNIFDVSVQLYGSVEGMLDLMLSNPQLTMDDEMVVGSELTYNEFVLNETTHTSLQSSGTIVANGERLIPTEEVETRRGSFSRAFSISFDIYDGGGTPVKTGSFSKSFSNSFDTV